MITEPMPTVEVSVPDRGRCTVRKHVVEVGAYFCDCGAMILGKTAAGNAHVVTLIDHVVGV